MSGASNSIYPGPDLNRCNLIHAIHEGVIDSLCRELPCSWKKRLQLAR